jgi:glycosyltransferase involved in cell wall biosynthesis
MSIKSTIFISVICPVYNEEKYISKFIDSIIAQDYNHNNMEVFLIDGGSTDDTVNIVKEYCSKYHFLTYLNNPETYQVFAINKGIKASKGDYIIRLDAHSVYPSNYFSSLLKSALELNADNIGGICKTVPANDTNIAKSIALTMGHPFGVGNSMFRIGTNKIIETDTVPFGCYKRSVFDSIGYFDEELKRNEDDEFNARLLKNGGKIFLNPEIVVDYYGRDSLSKISMMFYQYGFFKPLVNYKCKSITTIRQIVPLLFVLFLIFGFIFSFTNKFILLSYLIILLIYLVLSFTTSFFLALKNKNFYLIFLMPLTFFLAHLSYGWGYLLGLFSFNVLNKKNSFVSITR